VRQAIAPWLFALTPALVGCGGDPETPSPDAEGVRVTGCDDPSLWVVPALEHAQLRAEIGGGPCSAAQYPLHRVFVSWSPTRGVSTEEREQIDRTCWRVTAAAPGSGWAGGEAFAGGRDGGPITVMGFARPITVEGRVLRADGTVAFAVDPDAIALDEAVVLDGDAVATTAVMSPEAWVERDAVELWGQRVATAEVLDATVFPFASPAPFTLHDTGSGLVRRSWWRDNGELQYADTDLGPGTRARIAKFGAAVVVDDELLLVGHDGDVVIVKQRVQLDGEPVELTGNYYAVTLHVGGALAQYDYATLTARSLPVGDGVLLPANGDGPPVFFDGATFHTLDPSARPLAFDAAAAFTPRPEDLAALGAPVAVMHGIVLGERGLLAAIDAGSTVPGPRFASFAALFGDGTIGPVSADSAAYVIARGDGSAALYRAPFVDFCE
jgi:hypothetical protein